MLRHYSVIHVDVQHPGGFLRVVVGGTKVRNTQPTLLRLLRALHELNRWSINWSELVTRGWTIPRILQPRNGRGSRLI